jgi:hypothetical protein
MRRIICFFPGHKATWTGDYFQNHAWKYRCHRCGLEATGFYFHGMKAGKK